LRPKLNGIEFGFGGGEEKEERLIEESHCVHEYAGKTVHNSDQIDLLNPRETVKL